MKRQLHLNLFIHGRGHHEASWRHAASSVDQIVAESPTKPNPRNGIWHNIP
jgi:hypothetical protein